MDKPRVTKREKLYRVGDIVDAVIEGLRGSVSNKSDESLTEIKSAWDTVVGDNIKTNTSLISFKGGVLVISVKKSVWRSELEYMKGDIVKKINKYIGRSELRNIILR